MDSFKYQLYAQAIALRQSQQSHSSLSTSDNQSSSMTSHMHISLAVSVFCFLFISLQVNMLNLLVGSSIRFLHSRIFCNFTKPVINNHPYRRGTSSDLRIKTLAENLANQQRKRFLQFQVLVKGKHVLHGDVRQDKDTIFALRNRGKCPGVIRREGYEDVDVVLSGKQIKDIYNDPKRRASPVTVRVGGQDIKCMIDEVVFHGQMFIQKVELRRFIEGKPNYISVPIQFQGLTENDAFMSGIVPKSYSGNLSLITYNEDYPPCIFIDVSYVHPLRPYRIADVANMLPPGIQVHPKHNLNERLFTIGQAKQQKFYYRKADLGDGPMKNQNEEEEEVEEKPKKDKPKVEAGKTPAAGGKAPAAGGKAPTEQKKPQGKK